MTKKDIVEEAIRRFKLVCDAEAGQRQREVEDLRFQVPEEQWDETSRQHRRGGSIDGSGVMIPARPTLSIPKLDQPVQLVVSQQRSARLGIQVHPLSEDAEKDTAEVIQGLYRAIERDSRASEVARAWAFDRATKAGRGCYRVDVKYDDSSSYPFDLKVTIDRILHQQDVYFDPAAEEPDWCDGRWAHIVKWMPYDEYKKRYPKTSAAKADPLTWENMFQNSPGWAEGSEDNRAILLAQYWTRETEEEEIALLDDGQVVPTDSIPNGRKVIAKRPRETSAVKWYLMNGAEIIDEGDWLGRYIPLIPVIGRELQPYNQERRWTGLIGPAKDGQRLYNFAASAAVELVALEPRAPFIGDPRQFDGYEAWWQQANVRNFPYLPYNYTLEGNTPVPPPMRVQIDSNRLGPTMALLSQADQFIQAATGTWDPALGRVNEQQRSGRAILALQSQSDAGTSGFLQNLADISMILEAKVVLDLMPKVYTRPGRVMEILTGEDQAKKVMLNIPYQMGPDGNPRAAQLPQDAAIPPGMKYYDLSAGAYGVTITVGKSYQTRLQQGAEEISPILQALPPELQVLFLPTYLRFRDFPGAQELADMAARFRDQRFPGIGQKPEDGMTPEQMSAQLAATQQQLQALQQQLQQAMQAIETDQVKAQATLEKAKMDNQTRIAIEAMKAQNEQLIARFEASMELLKEMAAQLHESQEKGADRDQASREKDQDRRHAAASKSADAAMKVGLEELKLTAPGPNSGFGSDYDEEETP